VADDNSNIQKMVALALKDEGIDVVAVGNGEAAMRKIPDLRPDLVLADIFMPVRNGYEVCEFVKSDSRYMNTPVVLLVGAFDPLDEQETQRVRADGVLKKPFIPPDPLINMVKALLAKNGQKPLPVPAVTPVKPATPAQTTPVPLNQPSSSRGINTAPAEESLRQRGKVSSSAQQPPPFIAPAKQPAPAPQTAKIRDSDEMVTSARDANLGDPSWATPAEPQELEEKTETQPQDMLDLHSFGKDESSVEPEEAYFRPDSPLLDSADFGADLGATIVSHDEPVVPQQTSSQPGAAGENDSNSVLAQSENDAPSLSASLETPMEMFKFDPTLTFPAAPPDAAAEDAAPLSRPAAAHTTAQPPATAEKPYDTHEQIEPIELELLPDHDSVITAATEAARLAFSELNTLPDSGGAAESSNRNASVTQKDTFSPSLPAKASPSLTPEMIEAVVSRLLERMQPEIMEVVNREVLRPAIEAMVRRVMEKG
jgi:CheY-like chemotaxis protein